MSRKADDRIGRHWSLTGAAALAVVLLALSCIARAQQASDGVVVIGEGGEGSAGFFERYVFGSIGFDAFFGSPISRNLVAARLGVDYPFAAGGGSGRLYIEGGYARRSASLEQKRVKDFEWDPESGTHVRSDLAETRELDVSASGAELREAYLQYDLADNLSLSLGYQRPIWGQFDIVSPVNLLLPLEFQSDDLSFQKSAFRMPQPAVSAVLFPHERLEVSGYVFSGTNLDPLYEEILDEADGDNEVFVAGRFGQTETRPRPREDVSGYDAHAARAVWYGDSFTFGLTYYEGRNTLFAFEELPLVTMPVVQTDGAGGGRRFDAYSVIERSLLPSSQAVGVELSVPAGRWTWKGEAIHMSTETDISGLRRESIAQGATDAISRARRNLYEWIVDENGGRGYVDVDFLMVGGGFDALYDHWRFGASAFVVSNRLDDRAKEADRLVQAAYSDDDAVGFSTEVLPNAYVFYDFDEERTRTTGLVGGFAGPFFGLSAFYTSRWLDDWRWTASLEYAVAISDQLLSELNSDSESYELEDAAALGVRLGAVYEF